MDKVVIVKNNAFFDVDDVFQDNLTLN